MNKKLIRLTESDLHKIVKESVNRVLTELDWRTYANAAKKSKERASDDWEKAKTRKDPKDYSHFYDYDKHSTMARDFDSAASQALDKKYDGRHSVSTEEPHIQWIRRHPNSDIDMSFGGYRPLKGYEENWSPYAHPTTDKYHLGDKEMSDFVKGNSKYIKGKGWQ